MMDLKSLLSVCKKTLDFEFQVFFIVTQVTSEMHLYYIHNSIRNIFYVSPRCAPVLPDMHLLFNVKASLIVHNFQFQTLKILNTA